MTIGRSSAVALIGLRGALVGIEADIAAGLPRFAVVGLPDRALTEATDRVRSAIVNSGLSMPSQRVTVNLSPAGLPKAGTGFDLGIAMAALAASGQVSAESVGRVVHIGELALDGRLRPTPGVLPAVMGAAQGGASVVIVPRSNADEAELVPGVRVIAISSLRDAAIWHGAQLDPVDVEPFATAQISELEAATGDLTDIIGNRAAVSALIAAAAGGHHISMVGPPGAGKTMLATRLAGILPDLTPAQALEVACIQSIQGSGGISVLPVRPPLEAPHHSATTTALIGGGSGVIRPGAIARAAHGVLFLDEAPEFAATTLDALRQPLETGHITIHRSAMTASFPAKFMLILAANPCPCGNFGVKGAECTCPPIARRRYLAKLSGPLRDRIDIHLAIDRLTRMSARGDEPAMTSAEARELVLQARIRARERWSEAGLQLNADVPGAVLRSDAFRPAPDSLAVIDAALARGSITARGYDRTLRLAWTLADLDQAQQPSLDHVGRALLLRRGAYA